MEENNSFNFNKKEVKFEKISKKTKAKKENNQDYKDYEKVLEKSKKRKKKIFNIMLAIAVVILIGIFCIIFSLLNINNTKMLKNVSIQGIDISGMTQEEAQKRLEELFKEKNTKEILLKYQNYETTLNTEIIEINYNIAEAVERAYSIGRSNNIVKNNFEILGSNINKKDIKLNITLNEEELKKILQEISKNLPGTIIESSYYIEGETLVITKGKEGIIVDESEFLKKIYEELNQIDSKQEFIEIPVKNKKPEEIDLEKIKSEIYKEAQNAYLIQEPFEIHPEVNGVDFDLEKAKEIIKNDQEEYNIPLIITKPEITLEKIGSEAFPDTLSSYTTKYDMSNRDRTTNLQLAVNKINGTILLSGEEFSYNAIVGERTIAAGYKEAKVYQNGQVVDGLGGGICQISSTLYNAVVLANLEVTQRRNHQFVTSYLPAGRDATVVYGSQDFKFKNTRKYPIKIKASVNNGVARLEIKGLKEETDPEISLDTKTVSTIPFSIKYIDDNTMDEGTEKIEQKGVNGIVTQTYKVEKTNGVVTSKTLLSKDTYNAMQKIVRRGTKKIAQETKEQEKEQTNKKEDNKNKQKEDETTEKSNKNKEENKQQNNIKKEE